MTVIKLAYLVHYSKFRERFEKIINDINFDFVKFIKKNKKLYKFIRIKYDNNKVKNLLLFQLLYCRVFSYMQIYIGFNKSKKNIKYYVEKFLLTSFDNFFIKKLVCGIL